MSKIDKILKAFNKSIGELEVHVDVKLKSVERTKQAINRLAVIQNDDQKEADRAKKIATKLKGLIN